MGKHIILFIHPGLIIDGASLVKAQGEYSQLLLVHECNGYVIPKGCHFEVSLSVFQFFKLFQPSLLKMLF